MNKLFLSLLLSTSISFASVINGVAITVNDEPITLYDIEQTAKQNNVDKNQAASALIDKALYEQLVKKHNITADIFDVNEYIEKLAATNNMDVYTFKSVIKQKYPNYSIFEEEAKSAVLRQKLIQKIVKGQLNVATDEDMELYYENNKDQFTTANSFDIVKYTSTNKASLISALKSPLLVPNDVERTPQTLQTSEIPPQLQYLLTETKVNSFTPIFTADRKFTAIFITKKSGQSTIAFENVKGKIFNDLMKLREKKYLKEYFEKEKLTADIKIVR